MECLFCSMSDGSTEVDMLFRDEDLFVIKDIDPKAAIHLLIIPRRHLAGLAYASGKMINILGQMFVVAEEMARREGVTLTGYRLILNQGTDARQAIKHLHMHLLGGNLLGDLG